MQNQSDNLPGHEIVFKKGALGGQNEIKEGPVVEAVSRKKKACSSK